MRLQRPLFGTSLAALMLLAACGGSASVASSPAASAPPPPSSAAAKPSVASAKPKPSAAPSVASAKPAVSASAKPSAAPKPTATTLPTVAADTAQVTLTKIPIPALAGKKSLSADIMEVDQAAHLLYLTDRATNGVDIFDISSFPGKFVKTIPVPGKGTNGLTIAKNVNKIIVGNNDSTVSIIDIDPKSPKVDTVIATVSTGGKKRADETDYDPNTKKAMVANSDDNFVSIIDMTTNKIVAKINTTPAGGIEQPRYNPTDKFMYLTGSENNIMYQFDMIKDTMTKQTDVVDKCNPNGNAINPTLDIALLGCSNKAQQHTAIWDFKTSKVTSTTDKVGAGDAAIYDAKANKFFFAASNYYRGGQMGIFSGNGKFIANVPTAVGAHAVAYDETNNALFAQDQLPNQGAVFTFKVPTGPGGASGAASVSAKPAAGGASAKPSA